MPAPRRHRKKAQTRRAYGLAASVPPAGAPVAPPSGVVAAPGFESLPICFITAMGSEAVSLTNPGCVDGSGSPHPVISPAVATTTINNSLFTDCSPSGSYLFSIWASCISLNWSLMPLMMHQMFHWIFLLTVATEASACKHRTMPPEWTLPQPGHSEFGPHAVI